MRIALRAHARLRRSAARRRGGVTRVTASLAVRWVGLSPSMILVSQVCSRYKSPAPPA